jgi:hypothetical protein
LSAEWGVLWTSEGGASRVQEYAYGEDHARTAARQAASLATWPVGEVVSRTAGGPWLPSPAPGKPRRT